mmetsp:Transcript_17374/g.24306  ORF Transcript_17374/g.24306 Transcript_17374/m.24306 type:complete len:95 (-) Transcript_17374:27-311(-)
MSLFGMQAIFPSYLLRVERVLRDFKFSRHSFRKIWEYSSKYYCISSHSSRTSELISLPFFCSLRVHESTLDQLIVWKLMFLLMLKKNLTIICLL